MIGEARSQATAAVNVSLTALYWRIGRRLGQEVLAKERAGYGEQVMESVAKVLTSEYGRGYTKKNLWRMVQFAEAFPDEKIVATLWRQLSWSHFRELLPLPQPFQREFYAEMSRIEGWSVRTLQERIDSMLYERTALSKKPDALIRRELDALRRKGDLTPALVLKDPYVLDFLGLSDRFMERDVEDAILRELETFLLELGAGFSFVARQKRIQLDGDDFTSISCSTTGNSNAWSRLSSSRETSSLSTKVKWSFTCAGSPSTKGRKTKRFLLALSFALGRTQNRLNCWN